MPLIPQVGFGYSLSCFPLEAHRILGKEGVKSHTRTIMGMGKALNLVCATMLKSRRIRGACASAISSITLMLDVSMLGHGWGERARCLIQYNRKGF